MYHIITANCNICKKETEERCKLEHPKWFTPKQKDRKMGSLSEIEDYINSETPVKKCFFVEGDLDSGVEDVILCADHLKDIVDKIERTE